MESPGTKSQTQIGQEGCSSSVGVVDERGGAVMSEAERPAEGAESRMGGARELGGEEGPTTERRPRDES